jgi:hypothetical protein
MFAVTAARPSISTGRSTVSNEARSHKIGACDDAPDIVHIEYIVFAKQIEPFRTVSANCKPSRGFFTRYRLA